jgi:guanylate cyclase
MDEGRRAAQVNVPVARESQVSLDERPRRLRKMYAALEALDIDREHRAEVRLVRRLQFVMALFSVPAIGAWAGLFLAGGHVAASLWPLAYVALTLLLVGAFALTGNFAVLRIPHVLVVAALPVGLTVWMGGFARAGGAMLWTLLVPITATMFGFAHKTLWFLGAVAAALAVFAFAHVDAPFTLGPRELELHFAFNAIGFTMFLYTSVRYFVDRIDAERARAEGILRRVLPAPIVRRLKRSQGVIADHLDRVTVVFADICGFTPLAARLSATQIVELLDTIFTAFDELAAEHGVEKIKTIGDAYMAVAGAPERAADHALRAARLAIAMRAYVQKLAAERDIELSMRIGLHTGEVVAGVIGIQRFAYDLWGDTVNTASRMESHGQPDQIQITAATREAILATKSGDLSIRERGPIEVKGRGTIVTYWLD